MKASQKIALEMSTKREALNALLLAVDEMSDETQRTEMGALTTRMQQLESRSSGPRSWPKTCR